MAKKILTVDDSDFMKALISKALTPQGYEVLQERDGKKAVGIAKDNSVDLILLDLQMPFYSGEQVFHDLKADGATKDIPVILLTAKADAIQWNNELKASDGLIKKPFIPEDLLKTIKRILKAGGRPPKRKGAA